MLVQQFRSNCLYFFHLLNSFNFSGQQLDRFDQLFVRFAASAIDSTPIFVPVACYSSCVDLLEIVTILHSNCFHKLVYCFKNYSHVFYHLYSLQSYILMKDVFQVKYECFYASY